MRMSFLAALLLLSFATAFQIRHHQCQRNMPMNHLFDHYLLDKTTPMLESRGIDNPLELEEMGAEDCIIQSDGANEVEITNVHDRPNQYDRAWMKKYQLLHAYYKTHGNCLVPVKTPHLGRWLQRQRAQYKRGEMSHQRIKSLEDIDFVFDVHEYNRSKSDDIIVVQEKKKWRKLSWDERYDQLSQYYQTNKHSNVPQKYGSLGGWVQLQRRSKAKLSQPQKDKLEAINFVWDVNDYKWKQKYEQLREFVTLHNHSEVPSSKKALNAWCGAQRSLYSLKYSNGSTDMPAEATALTDERESLLTAINFNFETNHEHSWNERIQQLNSYKEQHGQLNLGKKDGPLGAWGDTQRTEYRFKLANQHSHLSDERIEQLNELGFVWSMREALFEERYNAVLRYFIGLVDDEVSEISLDPQLLAVWLRDQKVLYSKKRNTLSEERVAKLNTLFELEELTKK